MTSTEELKLNFVKYTKENKIPFVKKLKNSLRMMIFNVHLWKDLNEINSYDAIMKIIANSNSDIVGLLESLFFSVKKEKVIDDLKTMGYNYIVMCNPKYGINLLASKFKFVSHSIIPLSKDPIKKQSRYAIHSEILINTKKISIVLTHLDVYDETEKTRHKQICEILKKYDHVDLIMGDFNSLRKDDYSQKEWIILKNNDKKRNVITRHDVTTEIEKLFTDSFISSGKLSPKISVWSNRRIDYIYVNNNSNCDLVGSYIYPTLSSDHYPVYVDIDWIFL